MSFAINNNLSFIGIFQFVIFSLDSLVKNLNKDDFKYLSQEFDKIKLDLVRLTIASERSRLVPPKAAPAGN